jgi:hypothetical protein
MTSAAEDFEATSRAALARELGLLQQQAAKRARDEAAAVASPERKLDKRRLLAGALIHKGVDRIVAQNLAATRRSRMDGPEINYGRDPW